MDYRARNWQNHQRPLTPEEIQEIRSKISGVHFSKECHDNITLQMLYCAEALLREYERDNQEGPRCPYDGTPLDPHPQRGDLLWWMPRLHWCDSCHDYRTVHPAAQGKGEAVLRKEPIVI